MTFLRACSVSDVEEQKPHAVTVDGVDLALVRDGDDFYAIFDECSHAAIPLSEGEVEGCLIECWLHGSTFDLRTGRPTIPPASEPVDIYPVKVDGGDLLVDVENPITEDQSSEGTE